MVEDIRNRQEHIQFLENFIVELTEKIDGITDGRDLPKLIRSLEYRLEVLGDCEGKFNGRVHEYKTELETLKTEYSKIAPIIEKLEEERAYYRSLQSKL